MLEYVCIFGNCTPDFSGGVIGPVRLGIPKVVYRNFRRMTSQANTKRFSSFYLKIFFLFLLSSGDFFIVYSVVKHHGRRAAAKALIFWPVSFPDQLDTIYTLVDWH